MRRYLAGLALVIVIAAGCGGSNDPTPTPEPAAAPAAPTAPAADEPSGDDGAPDPAPEAPAVQLAGDPAEVDGVVAIEIADNPQHVEGTVDYSTSPPVGGDHDRGWQNCGFYLVEVPNEQAVHSLEHGAVWITYRGDVSSADLDTLEALAADNSHVLVTRYEDQPVTLMMSAWARQAVLPSADDPLLGAFLDEYLERGPTTPEPGATCAGAYGVPPSDTSTIG